MVARFSISCASTPVRRGVTLLAVVIAFACSVFLSPTPPNDSYGRPAADLPPDWAYRDGHHVVAARTCSGS